MTERPSLAVLADWAEGRLEKGQDEQVERAIAADPATASAAAWVADVLDVARRVPLERPPADLGARLRALFDRPDDGGDLPST